VRTGAGGNFVHERRLQHHTRPWRGPAKGGRSPSARNQPPDACGKSNGCAFHCSHGRVSNADDKSTHFVELGEGVVGGLLLPRDVLLLHSHATQAEGTRLFSGAKASRDTRNLRSMWNPGEPILCWDTPPLVLTPALGDALERWHCLTQWLTGRLPGQSRGLYPLPPPFHLLLQPGAEGPHKVSNHGERDYSLIFSCGGQMITS